MKRLARFSALALCLSMLSGCSWFSLDWLWGENGYFRDRANDYQESRQLSPMKVPSSFETRPLDPLFAIPHNVADSRIAGGYETPRPQRLVVAGTDLKEFSLQVTPEQRWLIAQHPPSQLWLSIRQFMRDNGLILAEEKPHMGELVTAWQKVSELPPVLQQVAPAAGDVRFRIRIEPGVQRNTSEIFVLTMQRQTALGVGPEAWPARSMNASLEAAVLDEIQTSFAKATGVGDTVSLLAERDYDAPSHVAMTRDASGAPILTVDTDFDRAWSRVGSALESADIRVEDLNRTLGIYYINLAEGTSGRSGEKQSFWNMLFGRQADPEELEARAERYQLRVARADKGNGTQISVEKDINTLAPVEAAQKVLNLLQEHLGNSSTKKKPGAGGQPPQGKAPDARGDRPSSR